MRIFSFFFLFSDILKINKSCFENFSNIQFAERLQKETFFQQK